MTRWTDSDLLTTPEAAEFLAVSTGTLKNWSSYNYGPKPQRIPGRGRRNFYKFSELKKWKQENVK